MKKLVFIATIAVLTVALSLGTVLAQRGGGRYCPWMGGTGPGPQGQQGGWYCPWMGSQTGPPVAKPGQPLTTDQAKALVEQHIGGNPNLKAGKVTEKDGEFFFLTTQRQFTRGFEHFIDNQWGHKLPEGPFDFLSLPLLGDIIVGCQASII